jgi:site-specific DNA-methyltransferase (adenine-specific)
MENYEVMRKGFNNGHIEYLRREYEYLRREYEDLRREYEDLRRPFNASPERPYTDVWTFKTVSTYPGKHPCEKPLPLMEHIIQMSSKIGGVVFDCCCGNGTTLLAAMKHGRHWYGCDIEEKYVTRANERIEKTRLEMSQMELIL